MAETFINPRRADHRRPGGTPSGSVIPIGATRNGVAPNATAASRTTAGTATGSAAGRPEPLWRHVLGERLRRVRHERGETLGEVATRAGLSPQYLSEIERGLKEPSSEIIAAVAGSLDVTLVDLTLAVAQTLSSGQALRSGQSFTTGSPVCRAAFCLAA